jgi:hypothetical protein
LHSVGGEEHHKDENKKKTNFFYFEVTLPADYFNKKGSNMVIGFDTNFRTFERKNNFSSRTKTSFYYCSNGKISHDGKDIGFSSEWENGATIGAGWDLKRNEIFFSYKNDTTIPFVNRAFTAAQLSGIERLIPSIAVQRNPLQDSEMTNENPDFKCCIAVEDLWLNEEERLEQDFCRKLINKNPKITLDQAILKFKNSNTDFFRELINKNPAITLDEARQAISKLESKKSKFKIQLADVANNRMLWEKFTDKSVYEMYLSGDTNVFVHPLQIKQVIQDVLSIMTGTSDIPLENQAITTTRKGKAYRCAMFLGDQRHKGKEKKKSHSN